jgi:hypothetical protein
LDHVERVVQDQTNAASVTGVLLTGEEARVVTSIVGTYVEVMCWTWACTLESAPDKILRSSQSRIRDFISHRSTPALS